MCVEAMRSVVIFRDRHMNLNEYADKIEKAALSVRVTLPVDAIPGC